MFHKESNIINQVQTPHMKQFNLNYASQKELTKRAKEAIKEYKYFYSKAEGDKLFSYRWGVSATRETVYKISKAKAIELLVKGQSLFLSVKNLGSLGANDSAQFRYNTDAVKIYMYS